MKRALSIAILAGGLSSFFVASAETVSGQGGKCDSTKACPGELQCVPRKHAASTCELVCAASSDCPADERCVKDDGQRLCRPITDEDLIYREPRF